MSELCVQANIKTAYNIIGEPSVTIDRTILSKNLADKNLRDAFSKSEFYFIYQSANI